MPNVNPVTQIEKRLEVLRAEYGKLMQEASKVEVKIGKLEAILENIEDLSTQSKRF